MHDANGEPAALAAAAAAQAEENAGEQGRDQFEFPGSDDEYEGKQREGKQHERKAKEDKPTGASGHSKKRKGKERKSE